MKNATLIKLQAACDALIGVLAALPVVQWDIKAEQERDKAILALVELRDHLSEEEISTHGKPRINRISTD